MTTFDPLQQRDFVPIEEHISLIAKLQYLVDCADLPEHCFTFPDGDTWWQTGWE